MMKKTYIFVASAAVIAAALSCSRELTDPAVAGVDRADEVKLVCVVPGSATPGRSKFSGIIEPTTNTGESVSVGLMRIDRTEANLLENIDSPDWGLSYTSAIKGGAAITKEYVESYPYSPDPHYYWTTASMEPDHEDGYRLITDFQHNQFFKGRDNIAQYIAWSPAGTNNGTGTGSDPFRVTEPLDLKTDVLYSKIVSEDINRVYADTVVFKHALTQFRLHIYRMHQINDKGEEMQEGVENWGRLRDIKLLEEPDEMYIQLPDTRDYYSGPKSDKSFRSLLPIATVDAEGKKVTYPENCNKVFFVGNQTDAPVANTVEIPVGKGNALHAATFLAVPPANGCLSLEFATTLTSAQNTITIANDFKPGYAYDVIIAFSDHGLVNNEISVLEWKDEVDYTVDVDAVMYYDLSRYGTSNCYLVTSANTGYTFNATVKGCGNDLGGADVVGVSDWTLPTDSYIEVVYDPSGIVDLQGHTLVDGNVIFKVNGDPANPSSPKLVKKGNAIIAARNGKGGPILWSWHIWVTDPPIEQGYANGYTFLDRNLGATVAPMSNLDAAQYVKGGKKEECGFYYQWGRKDPMIPGFTTCSSERTGIDGASGNIFTLYGAGANDGWLDDSDFGLDRNALWGYRENKNMVKTIFDPCPPGYRVPEDKAWTTPKDNKTIWDWRDADWEKSVEDAVPGYKNAFFVVESKTAWYPGASWMDALSLGAGSTAETGDRVTRNYAANDSYVCDAKNGQLTVGTNRANALPVRCISTNVQTVVTDLSRAQTANCYVVPSAGNYRFKADVKGNGVSKVSVAGEQVSVFDSNVSISHSSIRYFTVLWWQGDLSGLSGSNNTAGTDCPIKFICPEGKSLPVTPSRNSDFTDDDLGVIDNEGYLQFKIEEGRYSHGNAIIAAIGNSGEILWTWHIWLSEDPKSVRLGPRDIGDYTHAYYSMDRNLGATYSPTSEEISNHAFVGNTATANAKRLGSYGFYYQWGRKDPFPGPQAVNNGGSGPASSTWFLRNISGDHKWASQTSIITGTQASSRGVSTINPTTFYKNRYNIFSAVFDASLATVNWYGTEYNDSNCSQYLAMWGFSASSNDSNYNPRMTKTVNDPCPPGYYIPHHYFFASAGLSDGTTMNTGKPNTTQAWQNMSDSRGLWLRTNDFNVGDNMWLPFCGYRQGAQGTDAEITYLTNNTSIFGSSYTSGVYYSGIDQNSINRTSGWFRSSAKTFSFGVRSTGGGLWGMHPADGCSIRCRAY